MSTNLNAVRLRCEYRVEPLGVDTPAPRLSWELRSKERGQRQTAYQIRAGSTPGASDLWDSGRVASAESVGVVWVGRPPGSGQRVYWQVRVWDRHGQVGGWSRPTFFETGLRTEKDWGGARWIRDPRPAPQDPYADDPAPLFEKAFTLPRAVKSARLYVTGLGYFEARVNGKNVSEAVLEPGWTNYTKRVYYRTFEFTKLLKRGENQLTALVAGGWWSPLPLAMFGGAATLTKSLPTGRPRLIAKLVVTMTDGSQRTIVTDEGWQVRESALRFQNNYLGEVWDFSIPESEARPVALATEPVGVLQSEPQPPIRQIAHRMVSAPIAEVAPGVFLYDGAVNQAGRIGLVLKNTRPGQRVTVRYGELRHPDGTLNPLTGVCGQIKWGKKEDQGALPGSPRPAIPAIQEDVFLCAGGDTETVYTRFVFRGFRYVEVSGASEPPGVVIESLASGVESAGEFSCSDPVLNQIQEVTRRTFLSNIFSVQSDCPHREKFGYGGDIVATRDAFLYNFDMAALYAKIVQDFSDAALPGGALPDTAPYIGLNYCGVGWPMAHPLLMDELLRWTGDRRVIEENYGACVAWLAFLEKKYGDGPIREGITDHEAVEKSPPEPTLTLLYAECLRLGARLAERLGKGTDARRFRARATRVERNVPKPPANSQTCLAYALEYAPLTAAERAETLARLVAEIERSGGLTTGIFGTRFLLDSLAREGRAEVACALAMKKTVPGWGAMLTGGATTLWEHWNYSDNTFSHNHPMFGSISAWFFAWLGGIQPEKDAVGFDRVALRPQFPPALNGAKARYHSVRGPIGVSWKRVGRKIALDISLPPGCTATLYLPDGTTQVLESGSHKLRV
jgi:alpha-L-rhamnosidase